MQVHHSKNNTNNITGPWNLETSIKGVKKKERKKEKKKTKKTEKTSLV